MLKTNEVYIKWNSANIKWYTSKGYVYQKGNMGSEFKVSVSDLSIGANVYVEVECDCCNIKSKWIWGDYLKQVKEDKKTYCKKCAINLYAIKNTSKTKLKNGKSFEQWCIENNEQDILNRWDYELNNCRPSDITYGSKTKYYFKCPIGIHKSELKTINALTNDYNCKYGCKMCNSFAQHLINMYGDNALELYWDWNKNNELKINPWYIDYTCEKKVWIKCQKKDYHGSYYIDCANFISNGSRCSYCYNMKIHPFDSLGTLYPQVLEVWSDKNKKSPYQYSPHNRQKVWWKCPDGKHKDNEKIIGDAVNAKFKCPECSRERDESFLQEKVRLHLESLNYQIKHEHYCTVIPINPKTKHKLLYDNEIVELKLIIEVHGGQHYTSKNAFGYKSSKKNNTSPEEEFHKRKLYDRYKRIFAKKQGYFYLEIPYWTDDKEETWKKMIDDKIKEIHFN